MEAGRLTPLFQVDKCLFFFLLKICQSQLQKMTAKLIFELAEVHTFSQV